MFLSTLWEDSGFDFEMFDLSPFIAKDRRPTTKIQISTDWINVLPWAPLCGSNARCDFSEC